MKAEEDRSLPDRRLATVLRTGRRLRTLGIDDSPFSVGQAEPVLVVGAVYSADQFEGLLSCRVTQDGEDATDRLAAMIGGSKFAPQLHLALLDGVCLGGFNVIDLPELARRRQRLQRAGPIHRAGELLFQPAGASTELVREAIARSVVQGIAARVPPRGAPDRRRDRHRRERPPGLSAGGRWRWRQ